MSSDFSIKSRLLWTIDKLICVLWKEFKRYLTKISSVYFGLQLQDHRPRDPQPQRVERYLHKFLQKFSILLKPNNKAIIRLVIRQAVARPWGRWLAGGSSTTSVTCLGLKDSHVLNKSRENCPNLTFHESPKTIISLLILKVHLAYIGLSTMKRDKIRYVPCYIIFTFY